MITPFLDSDVAPFLALAASEGWICESWEFDFLLRTFPQGCLVWRERTRILGYITSVRYGKSGWIGNLLVRPEARRHGIGRQLMEEAVSILLKSGVETVWLTASESGAGLYRKLGFLHIDTIFRWRGRGGWGQHGKVHPLDVELISAVDRGGWGDRRDALLNVTCGRGRLYSSSGGFICCQQSESGVQIGPWGCVIPSQAGALLDQALPGAGRSVFLDVPVGNHAATTLLQNKGFEVRGSNLLMYLGAEPAYQPDKVFALGSMGSMG